MYMHICCYKSELSTMQLSEWRTGHVVVTCTPSNPSAGWCRYPLAGVPLQFMGTHCTHSFQSSWSHPDARHPSQNVV